MTRSTARSFLQRAIAVHFSFVTSLLLAAALLIDLPGDPPPYAKPVGATKVKYVELLEDNTHIVYPALAVLTLVLIALGAVSAWRSDDLDGLQKAELKRDIIRELRREVWGMTAERLSTNVGVPLLKVVKVLEEMQSDSILEARTDTRRVTTWRVKGLSDGA
jgi:hypothetical protein